MAMFITQANLAFRLHPKKDAGPSGWLPTPSLSGTASMRAMRVSGPDQKHLRRTRCGSKFGRAKPESAYLTPREGRREGHPSGKGRSMSGAVDDGKNFWCAARSQEGTLAEEQEETGIAALSVESGWRIQKDAAASVDGSSGAASPVRRIDPVTGEITEVINTKTGILQRKGTRYRKPKTRADPPPDRDLFPHDVAGV